MMRISEAGNVNEGECMEALKDKFNELRFKRGAIVEALKHKSGGEYEKYLKMMDEELLKKINSLDGMIRNSNDTYTFSYGERGITTSIYRTSSSSKPTVNIV